MIPHTPGPWWATKNASYWQIDAMREDGYVSNIGDACGSSCSAPEPGWSMELGEANAKLMAAAPDLLAACKANAAWQWAEREAPKTTTFDERMELCNYGEWLTLRALLKADGKTPSDEPYAGLLCIWTGHRTEAGEVSGVVQRILNEYRAALAKAEGGAA